MAYTFDAASRHNAPGRYINHASRHSNLVLMQPVMIGKPPHRRLRIGLVAKRHIEARELFFNYGIWQDKDLPWLKTDAKIIGRTIDNGKFQSGSYIASYGTDHSQRREYPRVVCGPSACRVRVEFVSCPGRARVECLPEVHAQVPTHLYLPRENSPYILYVRTCTLRYLKSICP